MTDDYKDFCFIATSEPEGSRTSIMGGHAYCVIAAFEIEFERKDLPGQTNHHLLLIRNPWGFYEWDGLWSDSDPIWSDNDFNAFQ